jgi:hypothetical protein
MRLEDQRAEWERGCTVVGGPIVHNLDGYKTIYVILKHSDEEYDLNRYFKAGGAWQVSVDVSGSTCLCRVRCRQPS